MALLFLDLDDFKTVNDTRSRVGDQLLVQVADRIRDSIRTGDIRPGSAATSSACSCRSRRGVGEIADRLVDSLRAPFAVAGREIFVRGSVGIALAEPGSSADDLIRNADVAMYSAKGTARGQPRRLCLEEMHERVSRRLELSAALDRLDHSDMSLRYQPIVRLADGRTVGFEALLAGVTRSTGSSHRTRSAACSRERRPPADHALGTPVGLRRGAVVGARAPDRRRRRNRCSVNLSPADLQNPHFVGEVEAALDLGGLIDQLTLEITETAAMADLGAALRTMRDLRSLGVRLALDDFGTGHSSPISAGSGRSAQDRQAVRRPPRRRAGRHDVRRRDPPPRPGAGHALGRGRRRMSRQAALLLTAGCDLGQGYWFARPLLAESVREFLGAEASEETLARRRVAAGPPAAGFRWCAKP